MDKLTYDSLAEVFKQCHSKPNYAAGIFIPDYRRQKEFADEILIASTITDGSNYLCLFHICNYLIEISMLS